MSNLIKVEEGYSYKFTIYSIILFIISIIIANINTYFAIPSTIFGILLFFVKSSTVIDPVKMEIGRLDSLFWYKKIRWLNIKECKAVSVNYTYVVQRMNSRSGLGASTTTRVKNFKMEFIWKNGKKEIFHEYSKYDIVKKVINHLVKLLDLEVNDMIKESRISAINKRKRRR